MYSVVQQDDAEPAGPAHRDPEGAVSSPRGAPQVLTQRERLRRGSTMFGQRPTALMPVMRKGVLDVSGSASLFRSQVWGRPVRVAAHIGNALWPVLFGVWLALALLPGALLLAAVSRPGRAYAHTLARVARYFIWPMGQIVMGPHSAAVVAARESVLEYAPLLVPGSGREGGAQPPAAAQHAPVTRFVWRWIVRPCVCALLVGACVLCLLSLLFIPMAEACWRLAQFLWRDALSVRVDTLVGGQFDPAHGGQAHLTVSPASMLYLRHSIAGIPMWLVDLSAIVPVTCIIGFGNFAVHSPGKLLALSLASCVPLALWIGMGIAALSAQSTHGFSAVLSAFFGTVVELLLYAIAIKRGEGKLVIPALTGTLLGTILLLPGLAMVVGGLKYREQLFNKTSSGVSSVLLLISMTGLLLPTAFYQMSAKKTLVCGPCSDNSPECSLCTETMPFTSNEALYATRIVPFVFVCAVLMFGSYVTGVVFTLLTHKHIYDPGYCHDTLGAPEPAAHATDAPGFKRAPASVGLAGPPDSGDGDRTSSEDGEDSGGQGSGGAGQPASHGHEGPTWPVGVCVLVLAVATVLFALVSDLVVSALQELDIPDYIKYKFLASTVIALVTNTAEFFNAMQFAYQGNIALAIEVGCATASQVGMVQFPLLVGIAQLLQPHMLTESRFTFVVYGDYLVPIVVATLIFTYILSTPKTNYFEGIAFLVVYALLVMMFLVSDLPNP